MSAVESTERFRLLRILYTINGMLGKRSVVIVGAGTAGIDDSSGRHYDDVIRMGRGRNDPGLVRGAVEEPGPTIDWLDDLGFSFLDEVPAVYYWHEPYSTTRTQNERSESSDSL